MRTFVQGLAMAALLGLLSGSVMLVRADDKKDEKEKKDKPVIPDFPDIEDLLKKLGGGLDEDQMKDLRAKMKEMRERIEQFTKQMPKGGFGGFPGLPILPGRPGGRAGGSSSQEARLGAVLNQPTQALIDQLDLPKDQGLVLGEVGPNSPAAKVGMKANDILLEVNGKAVPSKKDEFDAVLKGIAADKAVEVVVMRKGKKETLKGLKLPEAKAAPQPQLFQFPKGLPALPKIAPGVNNSTIVTRQNDEFTVKQSSDGVTFVVKGKVSDGKPEVGEVTVEANGETKTYDGIAKVPAEHQAQVKKLAEMAAGRGIRLRK